MNLIGAVISLFNQLAQYLNVRMLKQAGRDEADKESAEGTLDALSKKKRIRMLERLDNIWLHPRGKEDDK